MNIGYIIDSYQIPAWLYEALSKTNQLNNSIQTVVVIKLTQSPHEPTQTKIGLKHRINHFVYNRLMHWDKHRAVKRYLTSNNNAFILRDIRTAFSWDSIEEIHGVNSNGSMAVEQSDLEHIKTLGIDVFINLSQCAIHEKISEIAQQGVWEFSFLRDYNRMEPIGFWEIYRNEGIVSSSLLKRGPQTKAPELLAKAVIPVNEEGSFTMTINSLAWDSSPLLYFCLRKLLLTNDPHLIIHKNFSKKPSKTKQPNALACALMLFKFVYRKLSNRPGFVSQHWHIHFSNQRYNLANHRLSDKNFIRIEQPQNKFWADPFIIFYNNKHYLIFEEYDYLSKKGILRIGEINEQGLISEPITILQEDFHFSNPYVFIEDGKLYLLPEQAESNEIALYQCIQFPDQWKKVATLLKGGYYVDPILLKRDGKWWLFVVEKMARYGFPSVYGQLWFADDLFGEWQEHPMSPIATDCRISRSAGAFFEENNQLIRPVQDCSKEYGYKINFLHIQQLSESSYQDSYFTQLEPRAFHVDGIHTYNFADGMTVIDTRKRTSKKVIYGC